MRKKRTKGSAKYFHIEDATMIKNVSLESLLSHPKTKDELTTYLSKNVLAALSERVIHQKTMVTFGTVTRGNVEIPQKLAHHNQEEADTLMLLHATSIEQDAEVVVFSPGTDELILLIQFNETLPDKIFFFF